VFGNLALIVLHRSADKSLLAALVQPNQAQWWIVGGTLIALAIAVFVEPVAEIFRFAPLGARDGLIALVAGVVGVAAVEAIRYARRSGRA
jgi:magnesium-transporting ATPase (P-type)